MSCTRGVTACWIACLRPTLAVAAHTADRFQQILQFLRVTARQIGARGWWDRCLRVCIAALQHAASPLFAISLCRVVVEILLSERAVKHGGTAISLGVATRWSQGRAALSHRASFRDALDGCRRLRNVVARTSAVELNGIFRFNSMDVATTVNSWICESGNPCKPAFLKTAGKGMLTVTGSSFLVS